MNEVLSKFKEYVYKFDMSDENIERKYYHSFRVMDFATDIAKSINLSENDIEVATISGLFHDYARFPQWEKYHTYSDLDSVDHGDLGVELLFNNQEIKTFYDNVSNYDEIYDAIKYHNKYEVPSYLSDHNKTITKIIRDADKLDIFNILINDKKMFLECDEEISEKVKNDFYLTKSISYKDIKHKNDKIILLLALMFDLNYDYSINYIKENKIINKLFESINNKELFKSYFDFIEDYISKK